jgi:predicted enzyme related to lactoylglutathione lyase
MTDERSAGVKRIGGVFFRSQDPKATAAWYRRHLGLPAEEMGAAILGEPGHEAVWAPFPDDTDYFGESSQSCMVNFVTDDLDALLERLRGEGVRVIEERYESEYGRFGWAIDGDGNRFELWQPPEP